MIQTLRDAYQAGNDIDLIVALYLNQMPGASALRQKCTSPNNGEGRRTSAFLLKDKPITEPLSR